MSNKPLITLEDYLTSSGKYRDRAKSPECTQEVKDNAKILISRVNAALEHLGITKVSISSGFRTSKSNASLSNSAKRSAHMTGEACDLVDSEHKLSKLFTKDILEKFDLYREDDDYTPTWVHLQTRPTKSGKRIFKP